LVTDEVTILDIVERTREFFEEQILLIAPGYPSVVEPVRSANDGPRQFAAALLYDAMMKLKCHD